MKTLEGNLLPPNSNNHYGIIVGKFNGFVVESLLSGAIGALKQHGVSEEQITVAYVPGAFEIPLATQQLAATNKFTALITLGAVIRGSTPHFDYVAGECAKGVSNISLKYQLPIAFGVLTVDSIEQAIERSGTKAGNKGAEAALTALEMANLFTQIDAIK